MVLGRDPFADVRAARAGKTQACRQHKRGVGRTVFSKNCECIAQKCTHLERLQPLASQLLLLSHCVLTSMEAKKKISDIYAESGNRTSVSRDYIQCSGHLCYSNSRTQWVVL